MPTAHPADVAFAYVADRLLQSIMDTPDDADALPDAIAATGTVTLTPTEALFTAEDGRTGIVATPYVFSIHPGTDAPETKGQLVNPQTGRVGTHAVVAGWYNVTYKAGGYTKTYGPLHISADYTVDAPFYIRENLPLTPTPTTKFVVNEAILNEVRAIRDQLLTHGASPEQVEQAVADYLAANPPQVPEHDHPQYLTAQDVAGFLTAEDLPPAPDLSDYATTSEVADALADKADVGHTHDERYVRTVNGTGPDEAGNVTVTVEGGTGPDPTTAPRPHRWSTILNDIAFGKSPVVAVATDSTGNDEGEWPSVLLDKFAATYPDLRIVHHLWNWQDSQYYPPTVVAEGAPATGGEFISDDFNRTETNIATGTASSGKNWQGAGTVATNGATAQIMSTQGALSSVLPTQASRVEIDYKVITATTAVHQHRIGVAMTNAQLTGYGIYATFQFNAGGTDRFFGLNMTTSAGNVPLVSLTSRTFGLVDNSTTPQDVNVVLDFDGTHVTLTVTAGETVETISADVPETALDDMGTRAGVMKWSGDGSAMLLDNISISTPVIEPQTLTVWNASRPGSNLTWQVENMEALFPQAYDYMIVAAGHNSYLAPSGFPGHFAAEVKQILAGTDSQDAVVAVSTQNPRFAPRDPVEIALHRDRQATLQAMAAENGWDYIPVYEAFHADGRTTLTTDGLHPSVEGSQFWGEAIWTYLRADLGIPA